MKKVMLYTDGACSGNPGPGGYGAILRYGKFEKEMSQGYMKTTNNRMELMAAIAGMETLKEPCEITLVSDSKYLCDAVLKGWLYSWEKNSWKKSDKKDVLNIDLWKRILFQIKRHKVEFVWVKGHDGHPENERCDRLAVEAYSKADKIADDGMQ